MRAGDVIKQYVIALMQEVDDGKHRMNDYSLLLSKLFDIPFEYVIEMDENRVSDAEDLKEHIFYQEFGDLIDISVISNHKISVFEVLLALAKRMNNDILCDPMSEIDSTSSYFWDMLHNLGIDIYRNGSFNGAKIDEKVTKWMHREFNFDGKGSIFPLQKPQKNQLYEEIWSQMQSYIMENY